MKVLSRAEFLKLPAGTFYAKGGRWYFDSIHVKDGSLVNDWYAFNPCWIESDHCGEAFERLDLMLSTGVSYPMDDSTCRDGCFEDDALFLVFELDDLLSLRQMINCAIAVLPQSTPAPPVP